MPTAQSDMANKLAMPSGDQERKEKTRRATNPTKAARKGLVRQVELAANCILHKHGTTDHNGIPTEQKEFFMQNSECSGNSTGIPAEFRNSPVRQETEFLDGHGILPTKHTPSRIRNSELRVIR